jgi:hypothetical protein
MALGLIVEKNFDIYLTLKLLYYMRNWGAALLHCSCRCKCNKIIW